jgi:DNA mismatch repair ATPase MutS
LTPRRNAARCLLDEIFRGTDAVERIAAATAVLRHLSRHHFVFATSHDVEQQKLLDGEFPKFHFSDSVVDGHYRFDYRLCAGPPRARNATRLLQLSGYPDAITTEADQIAARLASKRSGSLDLH